MIIAQTYPLFRRGGMFAFWGKAALDPRHPGEILSKIIEDVTHGPSHIAVCWSLAGKTTVLNSTLTGLPFRSGDGAQIEFLDTLLAHYPAGSKVMYYDLMPEVEARIDWDAADEFAKQTIGRVHYGGLDLVAFLVPPLHYLGCGKDPCFEVCSVYAASFYVAAKAFDLAAWAQTPKMLTDLADPKRVGGALFKPGVPIAG